MVEEIKIPENMKESVTEAFKEAVDKKVSTIKESVEIKAKQLDRKQRVLDVKEHLMKESVEIKKKQLDKKEQVLAMKEHLLKESAKSDMEAVRRELVNAKIKMESSRQRNQIKAKLLENKIVKEAEEAIGEYVESHKFEKLEMEDREKLVKLLNLFEEMLAVFGKKITDITEEADVQVAEVEEEATEAIEELVEEKEALENENEELKESIKRMEKDNIILETALKHNIADIDSFKDLCESVKFVSRSQFKKSIGYLVENVNRKEDNVRKRLLDRSKRERILENIEDDLVYTKYLKGFRRDLEDFRKRHF